MRYMIGLTALTYTLTSIVSLLFPRECVNSIAGALFL